MITGWFMPLQKFPEWDRQLVSATVQTCVVGSQPGSFDGMLNWIKFVVPAGGGFAFEELMACRSVHGPFGPGGHVSPVPLSTSAVEVTVNVMAGVGVGVGVTSGESVTVW
jgi:hypothetical protein